MRTVGFPRFTGNKAGAKYGTRYCSSVRRTSSSSTARPIHRFYVREGKVIPNPNTDFEGIDAVNHISDEFCKQQKVLFSFFFFWRQQLFCVGWRHHRDGKELGRDGFGVSFCYLLI